jgi:integrase
LTAAEIKAVAGDNRRRTFAIPRNLDLISIESRGLLTKFMAYLEREGFAAENQYPRSLSHLVKDGANLLDPENVKAVIAQQKKKTGEPWSDSMKMLAVYAYDAFCSMQGLVWKMPTYHQNEATIYVPGEKELDLLISAASRRMATFLGCLKETFADPSEILRAEWVDFKDNVFSINHPVKGHLPGKYELTHQLTCMLNSLPRKNKRIFPTSYKTIYSSLLCLRVKAANKFQNPALLQITFKSFRHWGGSMIAHRSNGNVLVIMRMLRHKSFKSSMKYIHTIEFKDEDFEETVASTVEEIRALGKAGWQKYDEMTVSGLQMHFYRKPKRFGGLKKLDDKTEKRDDRFLCSA